MESKEGWDGESAVMGVGVSGRGKRERALEGDGEGALRQSRDFLGKSILLRARR